MRQAAQRKPLWGGYPKDRQHRELRGRTTAEAVAQIATLLTPRHTTFTCSLAQFAREMIAERTHDKMSAGCQGRWVGGIPMFGYDLPDRGARLP